MLSDDNRATTLTELATLLRTLHTAPVDPARLPTDTDTTELHQRLVRSRFPHGVRIGAL